MAKICPRCGGRIGKLYKCNQCGGTFCPRCEAGMISKKCPYCGNRAKPIRI